MNEKTVASKGVSREAFAAVVIVFVVVIGLLLVGPGNIVNLFQRALPPDVEVTSNNARTGLIGLDYTLWVDVSVYNSGGPGTVTVWAKATQGSDSWEKAQSVHLEPRESKDLTFTFKEFSFWSFESGSYRVWVEY